MWIPIRAKSSYTIAWHTKPGLWTLDWTMDWTLDSIMDSIVSGSGVKGYSAAKLWCSWCCKLEWLIIRIIHVGDNHFRWLRNSNLAQSLCFNFSKPDECLWIRTTQFISSMTIYAEDWIKLWREKEWDLNPRPEYYSGTLSYRWAHITEEPNQVCI